MYLKWGKETALRKRINQRGGLRKRKRSHTFPLSFFIPKRITWNTFRVGGAIYHLAFPFAFSILLLRVATLLPLFLESFSSALN